MPAVSREPPKVAQEQPAAAAEQVSVGLKIERSPPEQNIAPVLKDNL